MISPRNEHCFANILRFSRPCSTKYDLHFSNIFLCSASPLSYSMRSHLTLALTMISSLVFLFILSSQPHLFILFKARQKFLSVTVFMEWYPENASQEARLICTSGVVCTHSRTWLDQGFSLMRFCNALEQLFCCSNGMLSCQAFLILWAPKKPYN